MYHILLCSRGAVALNRQHNKHVHFEAEPAPGISQSEITLAPTTNKSQPTLIPHAPARTLTLLLPLRFSQTPLPTCCTDPKQAVQIQAEPLL